MPRLLLGLLLAATFGCGTESLYLVAEGCTSDDQCKGARLCHQGSCVFPDELGLDGGGRSDGGGLDAGTDGGGPAGGRVGDPCEEDSECSEGNLPTCYSEEETFGSFPGGYCSSECGFENACPEGSVCGLAVDRGGTCLQSCESDADCREGYACGEFLGPPSCIPALFLP